MSLGKEILSNAPNNAILLLNGDLETNIAMYYHYCEAWRPDLTLLSMTHMTYEWFHRYIPNYYNTVVFPGALYHPQRGYSLKQFVNANIRLRPIVIIGSVIPGDTSLSSDRDFAFRRIGIGFQILSALQKEEEL